MERLTRTTLTTRSLVSAATLATAMFVVAHPAAAQTGCDPIEGTLPTACGFVWNDTNNNGLQDAGETGIPGAEIDFYDSTNTLTQVYADGTGHYSANLPPDTYDVYVKIEPGTQVSPTNYNNNQVDTIDNDGSADGLGNSTVTGLVISLGSTAYTDFGFGPSGATNPGTGTPGYWKNHPEAWPVPGVTVGGVSYSKAQAIAFMNKVGKDKSLTIFASLVSAILNVGIGNDSSCISSSIAAAQAWFGSHPPGSNVAGGSADWQQIEPVHQQLDAYNNGLLCAPHRN